MRLQFDDSRTYKMPNLAPLLIGRDLFSVSGAWVESLRFFHTWRQKQIRLSKHHLVLFISIIADNIKFNYYIINNRPFLKILIIINIIVPVLKVKGRGGFKGGSDRGGRPEMESIYFIETFTSLKLLKVGL
jgi:hypothetical protein